MGGNRETCKNAVLDELWGEYKCMKKHIRLYEEYECFRCKDYEKRKDKNK